MNNRKMGRRLCDSGFRCRDRENKLSKGRLGRKAEDYCRGRRPPLIGRRDGGPGHLRLLHNFARASLTWLREEQTREHLLYARHRSQDNTYKLTNWIFRTLRNRYYYYLQLYWLKTGTETEKLSDLPKVAKLTEVAEGGFESRRCGTKVCTIYIT